MLLGVATVFTLAGSGGIYGGMNEIHKKNQVFKKEIKHIDSAFQKLEERIDTFYLTDSKYFINNKDTVLTEEVGKYYEVKKDEHEDRKDWYHDRTRTVTGTFRDIFYEIGIVCSMLITMPSFFWGVGIIQDIRRKNYEIENEEKKEEAL